MTTETPRGWRRATIKDVCERVVVGYVGPCKPFYDPEGLPFLMGKNVRDGALDLRDLERVKEEFHRAQKKSQLRPGDVVVIRIGRSGEAAVVPEDLGEANCGGLVIVKQPREVLPEFLASYLNSPAGQKASLAQVRGVTRQTLNTKKVLAATIPFPPPDEQLRVLARIDSLQTRSRRAKEALDAIPPLLERFRQSVLAAAFRGDLTADWRRKNPDVEPASILLERIRVERKRRWIDAEAEKVRGKAEAKAQKTGNPWGEAEDAKALEAGRKRAEKRYKEPEPVDPEGLPELPEGWCWGRLDEVTRADLPICYGVVQPGQAVEGGVRLVRVCDLADGEVQVDRLRTISEDVAAQYERSKLLGGEALISIVGTVGRVATVTDSLAGANIARAIARLVPLGGVSGDWLARWLSTAFMQHRLLLDAREVARKTLNIQQLREQPVPLSPIAESEEISRCIGQARRLTQALRARAVTTSALRERFDASVLAAAFRGELLPTTKEP